MRVLRVIWILVLNRKTVFETTCDVLSSMLNSAYLLIFCCYCSARTGSVSMAENVVEETRVLVRETHCHALASRDMILHFICWFPESRTTTDSSMFVFLSHCLQWVLFVVPADSLHLVWPRLSLANRNRSFLSKLWEIAIAIFSPWGRCFVFFYKQRLNCIFTVHAICTMHDYFIIVTRTFHLSGKKHIIVCSSHQTLLLLPPLSQQTVPNNVANTV